ncbi:hypothetical protein M115_1802 [Bacteroides fragilis str. 3719 T6]|nr:hypothetical protein M115_1802 [Bacteroides fragilis str. 3719 T6]EYA80641.1 hypothetical protein M134_1886 [Bacteroides fragilis str. S24L34]
MMIVSRRPFLLCEAFSSQYRDYIYHLEGKEELNRQLRQLRLHISA